MLALSTFENHYLEGKLALGDPFLESGVPPSSAGQLMPAAPTHATRCVGGGSDMKCVSIQKLEGSEVNYTLFKMLLVTIMPFCELHCEKVVN